MTVAAATICDVCSAQKEPHQTWMIAQVSRYDLLFLPDTHPGRIHFDGVHREDICGANCAHKRLSQWLTTREVERTAKP